MGKRMLAEFSIRQPLPRNLDGVVYPYITGIHPASEGKEILEEPRSEVPPPVFLKEISVNEDSSLQVLMAIGIPENDFIPTLSLPDFVRLSRSNSLKWESIYDRVVKKYENLVAEEHKVASHFLDLLGKNRGNPSGNKNVLLFPGRWNTFSHQVATTLAEQILESTKFGVFIAANAHPLSD